MKKKANHNHIKFIAYMPRKKNIFASTKQLTLLRHKFDELDLSICQISIRFDSIRKKKTTPSSSLNKLHGIL